MCGTADIGRDGNKGSDVSAQLRSIVHYSKRSLLKITLRFELLRIK